MLLCFAVQPAVCVFSPVALPCPAYFVCLFFRVANLRRFIFYPAWVCNCHPAQYCNSASPWRRILFSTKLQFYAGFVFLKDRLFAFGIVQYLRFVLYATGITICTYTVAVLSRCLLIDSEKNHPCVLPITQVYFCMRLFFRKSVLKKTLFILQSVYFSLIIPICIQL